MFLCSMFEDSFILFGHLETELNVTDDPKCSMFNDPRNMGHDSIYIAASIDRSYVFLCSKFDSIPVGY